MAPTAHWAPRSSTARKRPLAAGSGFRSHPGPFKPSLLEERNGGEGIANPSRDIGENLHTPPGSPGSRCSPPPRTLKSWMGAYPGGDWVSQGGGVVWKTFVPEDRVGDTNTPPAWGERAQEPPGSAVPRKSLFKALQLRMLVNLRKLARGHTISQAPKPEGGAAEGAEQPPPQG